jgi:hypothetical protein
MELGVAAKPIERFVKKQIHDQGGWDRILERLASGETVADVARTLTKPDGSAPSRNWFSMLLHADPERSKRVFALRETEVPDALVDDALHVADTAQPDRDSIAKAKVRADLKLKVAGLMNRTRWGEQKAGVTVQVSVGDVHLDALRHRSVPIGVAAADAALTDGSQARETEYSLTEATASQQLTPSSSAA